MRLLRRHPDLVCQQMVELITEYLEGSLSRTDRKRFEAHIRHCPNCTNYLRQMRATIATTGALREEDLDPGVLEEFTDLFRGWLRDGGGDAAGVDDGEPD
jgi:anti-sigma factor RsiW